MKWPSAKTRNNIIVPLRQVFRPAKKNVYAASNPAKELEQEKHQEPAFETGARTSKLLALTWDDYDGKRLAINRSMVRREVKLSTKTNMAREVLLTQRAKNLLRECPTRFKGGPIFVQSPGGPCLDADGSNRSWRQALSDAGIRYRRDYNCRHTYASLGLTAGAKPGFLRRQLGHTLEIFFSTYAKYIKSEDDDLELAKIDAYKKTAKELAKDR
ncbi:tyrosine-type recombinase/integrase [Exilibacterium tricleocarpae]|uniref:tyrosine-type recombinase/integrase n=1 Tax=Exilibacterium tricleocarpae TaxID=2591008 RepID=UPI0015D33BDB|nr:tyrosine-type recombinase/integrase [Exilibacterium tricleocarpae]